MNSAETAVPKTVVLGTGAAAPGNIGHDAGIMSVFLVLKSVFFYSPGKGIQE